MYRKRISLIALLMIMALLVGCRSNGEESKNTEPTDIKLAEVNEETNVPGETEQVTLPAGEGIENSDDEELPPDDATGVAEDNSGNNHGNGDNSASTNQNGNSGNSSNTNQGSSQETNPNSGNQGSTGETEPGSDGQGGTAVIKPEGGSNATEPSEGNTTEPPATEPADGIPAPGECTFEEYLEMTPEQQQAYYESFSSPEEYFAWYNAAKAEYEANKGSIDVGGGNLDIGDYMGD